jgi:YidC/Oxa1 family membrane protein insertase
VADSVGGWHAFIYDSVPVQGMQAVLEAVQSTTGLPWWASIAVSTLAFRTALLPVVRYQARALARLAGAGPMLGALNQALSQRLDRVRPGDVASTTEACRAYAAGCSAALKAHKVSLLAAVASPLVQLPVFVTFALANRRMIDTAVPGLEAGGLAWFEDLTEVRKERKGKEREGKRREMMWCRHWFLMVRDSIDRSID